MSHYRVDGVKVSLGGAPERKSESKSSIILKNLKLINGRTLDFGCGYGFDADKNNWEKYDPYYFDNKIEGTYDTIVCINVISAVSSKIRKDILNNIQELLNENGKAYLSVPRNIPIKGKFSGYERRPQSYVILTLKSMYKDKKIEIYELNKKDKFKDKTFKIGEV